VLAALANIAVGLAGATGFIFVLFLVTWLVTRNDYDRHAGIDTDEQREAIVSVSTRYEFYREQWVKTNDFSALHEMLNYVELPNVY
jgi:hypothetical protein